MTQLAYSQARLYDGSMTLEAVVSIAAITCYSGFFLNF